MPSSSIIAREARRNYRKLAPGLLAPKPIGNRCDRQRSIGPGSEPALPNDAAPISQFEESLHVPPVAGHVGRKLRFPEVGTRRGRGGVPAALVHMPEAAMDEDSSVPSRQHQVGAAGKPPYVQAKSESRSMKPLPKRQLGRRVLTPDASHHPGSRAGVHDVRHESWNLAGALLYVRPPLCHG